MAQQTISVRGMACGGCEQTVEDAVAELDGVASVDADNSSDTVLVSGDVDPAEVADAIEAAGYSTQE
ncbi:MAG: heavy-metal-associated domain-containing protein [Halolamina sp.]